MTVSAGASRPVVGEASTAGFNRATSADLCSPRHTERARRTPFTARSDRARPAPLCTRDRSPVLERVAWVDSDWKTFGIVVDPVTRAARAMLRAPTRQPTFIRLTRRRVFRLSRPLRAPGGRVRSGPRRRCRSLRWLGHRTPSHRATRPRQIGTYELESIDMPNAGSVSGSAEAWSVVLCGAKSSHCFCRPPPR
jgi:hypothetical protein